MPTEHSYPELSIAGILSDYRLFQSVEPVEVTIAAGASSGTANLTHAIDPNRSFPLPITRHCADTAMNPAEDMADFALGTPDGDGLVRSVVATTNTANAGNARVLRTTMLQGWPWVIEAVRYGTVTTTGNNQADSSAFTAVDTARSFVVKLGQTTNRTTYNLIRTETALTQLSSTQVRINRGNNDGGGDSIIARFAVPLFRPGILKSLQKGSAITAVGTSTGSFNLSSGTLLANCLPIMSGMRQDTLGVSDSRTFGGLTLVAGTPPKVQVDSGLVNNGRIIIPVSVLEFDPKWLHHMQVVAAVIASGAATKDEAVNNVGDLTRAIAVYMGHTTSANLAGNNLAYGSLKLQSLTAARAERGGTPANTLTMSAGIMRV